MQILRQQIVNANKSFNDYVDCNIYDASNELAFHNVVGDTSLSRGQRYFDVIGASKNYRHATVGIQMKQSGLADAAGADEAINIWQSKKDTRYGENID